MDSNSIYSVDVIFCDANLVELRHPVLFTKRAVLKFFGYVMCRLYDITCITFSWFHQKQKTNTKIIRIKSLFDSFKRFDHSAFGNNALNIRVQLIGQVMRKGEKSMDVQASYIMN